MLRQLVKHGLDVNIVMNISSSLRQKIREDMVYGVVMDLKIFHPGNMWMAKGWNGRKWYIITSEKDEIGPIAVSDFKPYEHYITVGYALSEGNKSRIIVERFYGLPK